jgi:hypothetical protein
VLLLLTTLTFLRLVHRKRPVRVPSREVLVVVVVVVVVLSHCCVKSRLYGLHWADQRESCKYEASENTLWSEWWYCCFLLDVSDSRHQSHCDVLRVVQPLALAALDLQGLMLAVENDGDSVVVVVVLATKVKQVQVHALHPVKSAQFLVPNVDVACGDAPGKWQYCDY